MTRRRWFRRPVLRRKWRVFGVTQIHPHGTCHRNASGGPPSACLSLVGLAVLFVSDDRLLSAIAAVALRHLEGGALGHGL